MRPKAEREPWQWYRQEGVGIDLYGYRWNGYGERFNYKFERQPTIRHECNRVCDTAYRLLVAKGLPNLDAYDKASRIAYRVWVKRVHGVTLQG